MRKEEILGRRWLKAMGIGLRKPSKYELRTKFIASMLIRDKLNPKRSRELLYHFDSWKYMLFGIEDGMSLPKFIRYTHSLSIDKSIMEPFINGLLDFNTIEELDLLLTLAGKNYD